MKKLISIGVVLALLTMAVVPAAVAAQDIEPDTYAKVPFAIIGTGLQLAGDMLDILGGPMGLPSWLSSNVTEPIAQWTAGPLAWTVDMLAWGAHLMGVVLDGIPMISSALPEGLELGALFEDIACGLRTCFSDECSGEWTCNVTG